MVVIATDSSSKLVWYASNIDELKSDCQQYYLYINERVIIPLSSAAAELLNPGGEEGAAGTSGKSPASASSAAGRGEGRKAERDRSTSPKPKSPAAGGRSPAGARGSAAERTASGSPKPAEGLNQRKVAPAATESTD